MMQRPTRRAQLGDTKTSWNVKKHALEVVEQGQGANVVGNQGCPGSQEADDRTRLDLRHNHQHAFLMDST